jgi:murein endopeptidase
MGGPRRLYPLVGQVVAAEAVEVAAAAAAAAGAMSRQSQKSMKQFITLSRYGTQAALAIPIGKFVGTCIVACLCHHPVLILRCRVMQTNHDRFKTRGQVITTLQRFAKRLKEQGLIDTDENLGGCTYPCPSVLCMHTATHAYW